jgi:hypothetical protein
MFTHTTGMYHLKGVKVCCSINTICLLHVSASRMANPEWCITVDNYVQILQKFVVNRCTVVYKLTLNLLTTTIVAPPSNASKWQMGFNSAFKGLIYRLYSGFFLKF